MLVNATTNTTSQTTITITDSTETEAVVDGITLDFSPLMLDVTHALLFSPLWPSSESWSSITFCWEMYTGNPSLVISVLISKPSEVRGALSLSAICRAHQLAVLAFLHSVVSSPILAARASTSTTQHQVLVRVSNSLKINSNILLTCKTKKKMKL